MVIRWLFDGYLGVATEAVSRGLNVVTAQDFSKCIQTFESIIGSKIDIAIISNTADKPPYSKFEKVGERNVIYITESLPGSKLQAYLFLSECMACCAQYEIVNAEESFGVIEQVFFESRDPTIVNAEYPQTQAEREADLGALEILLPTSERKAMVPDFNSGALDTVELAERFGVSPTIVERAFSESYMTYCTSLAAQ